MPGKHRPGYNTAYNAALRAVLTRLRTEQPDTYRQWFDEAFNQAQKEQPR